MPIHLSGRCRLRAASLLLAVAVSGPLPGAVAQQATSPVLEYIAHASFVVQSPTGVRVAIDPFNSERWLGYSYPADPKADAVLVTHPHYDHDASYYFPSGTPVFRRPGRYAVGDVIVEGHQGRHADPYGKDFEQVNTVWVIETGGVRVAHLGDNGPLPASTLAAMGRIDVLLVPDDGQEHILSNAAVSAIRASLGPRITIPMHYRLEGFRDLPESLGPLGAAVLAGADRQATNTLVLDPTALASTDRTVVLRPSPEVRPWPQALADAWRLRDEGRPASGAPTGTEELTRLTTALRQAAALVPDVLIFQFELADALRRLGRADEAVAILERALGASDRQDTEYTMRARALVAELYAAGGRDDLAAAQYRLVARGSNRTALVKTATEFLTRHRNRRPGHQPPNRAGRYGASGSASTPSRISIAARCATSGDSVTPLCMTVM